MSADDQYVLTPLGAAYVAAMPDDKLMIKIGRDFKKLRVCPTSRIFPTKKSVEDFYREQKQRIRAVEPEAKS